MKPKFEVNQTVYMSVGPRVSAVCQVMGYELISGVHRYRLLFANGTIRFAFQSQLSAKPETEMKESA